MSVSLASELSTLVADPARVITAPAIVERLSKDFYWYSPILKRQLESKLGDIVVQPVNVDEVLAVVRYAGQHAVPVTVRGAGTGNYGQCIPLHGGIVLDLALMDKLEEITADGVAVCQPGLRLATIETEARRQGWELRMYPSTIAKASIGGFLGGGSGGIGSVAHGGLRDFDTVRAFEVVTMEEEPRVVLHEGGAIHEILHCWGTNGILTRIWFALTPAVEWTQFTAAFDTYDAGFLFAKSIAENKDWTKRLMTVFEWPIPSFFAPIKHVVAQDKTLVLIMIETGQVDELRSAAEAAQGSVTFTGAYIGPRTQPLLSDYTWNHTTLWAMKADPAWTYIQAGFSPVDCMEQFRLLRERYGREILFHIEFMKNGEGVIIPGGIPLVYFTGEQRLNELIAYCREIGVFIANPHVNYVEDAGRFRSDNIQLKAKQKYDPRGLLNPGKMISFQPEAVAK
ncbi:FAD-binding oxidoreductase [Acidicapsa ligni]|uniref:FAD-binding oxidoreductase n=1 Tax=Acidicapsa ligni TaxID=542300 RepID=UPI0021DFA353|nr:FAD-binding oxidoreductase [Acidicapsa ligni]